MANIQPILLQLITEASFRPWSSQGEEFYAFALSATPTSLKYLSVLYSWYMESSSWNQTLKMFPNGHIIEVSVIKNKIYENLK